MKLELIADSFFHKSKAPILKGEVNDFPESYLEAFPNVFKVYVGHTEKTVVEIKEESDDLFDLSKLDEQNNDLLDFKEPGDIFSDERLPASAELQKLTKTELSRMNGDQLKEIASMYGIDPSGYDTVKALRNALKEAI